MDDTQQQNEAVKRTEDVLAFINGIINSIPFSSNIQDYLNNIRASLQALRPPRIMIIGRRGSGKSSLINAMCECKVATVGHTSPETGEAQWKTYYDHGVDLVRILDTRGLQETDTPRQKDSAKTPLDSIKNAIKQEYPDVILLVCKAKEVHSATQKDLEDCESILKEIKNIHKIYDSNSLSVIGVLSQCDEVNPSKADIKNEKKQKHIQELRNNFYTQIQKQEKLREYLKTVVPTSACAEYEEGESGLIISDEDYRWNIDTLIETMMKYTPKERQGSFARMGHLKKTQRTIAESVKTACVIISGVVSANPIPGTSLPVVSIIQSFMIMYIGWLSGRAFSDDTVKDFLVTAGIGIGANAGMIGIGDLALIFLPGFGSIISATTGASATQGIGDAAIAYFLKDDLVR